ncbi:alpha-galactosidase [Streptomyces sp. PSKA54]|uniref:Alpha-galactosidase n=1 Tax=Streptomyces himalayensis subsp. aureolus TaxID=2758039 RepID=A0A7W2HJ70_9ACTN|nr:glycoside hydrolase family 36 protein [Streptomyces himalayensis]MBA4865830.1 alpha-galactosidase [Streptomyces himalayensis subsp. aureolus]
MTGEAATSPATIPQEKFSWGHAGLEAEFATGSDGALRITRLARPDAGTLSPVGPESALPLVEITALGHGNGWSGPRFIDSALGGRLRHRAHRSERDGVWHRLYVELFDEATGLAAEVLFSSPDGIPVVRSEVRLRNEGAEPLVLRSVSSLLLGALPSPDVLDVHRARNDWLAECRWFTEPLRAHVADIGREFHEHDSRACLAVSSRGSWPTDGHLAMGALSDRTDGRTWLWQIESAVAWRWDTGECGGGTYLALGGPTDAEHQWREHLAPGAEFTTEAAALALGSGFEDALAALTAYRRAGRRAHPDHTTLPVVFNDYMNTLMGDPTTEKLLPLIDAAASVGAEYFCIDSGWYDDTQGWWDSVGEWLPSERRFPGGGIQAVLDHIRSRGMVPGLWLEPEVVGVRSPVARSLSDDAFVCQDGIRVTEHGRHQLDLRHPAARAHLDATVDRIVAEWGVGYLKLDYNITVSPGGPLLGHARAWLDWLSSLLDRHPGLVIENCASGGMRMDGASLAVTQLQSTSDQQDALRYPPIAAAAPTAVPPEQGAVWAYPQPEFTDEEIAFTLGGALLGRIHLSGYLNRMSPDQLALVRQALDTYKSLRRELPRAVPFWPLGLPGWDDEWVALGLRGDDATYVSVWRRGGATGRTLRVPHLADRAVHAEILHTSSPPATATWHADRSELAVELPRDPACLLILLTEKAPGQAA